MALPKKRKTDIQIKSVDPQGGPEHWVDQFLEQNKQIEVIIKKIKHGRN